jgi:hypothetical protein
LYALGFSGDAHAELVHKADIFLLATLYDVNMVTKWAPSVLAAAAVALALSDARKGDVAEVVRRVREVFQADRAGSGDGEMVEIEFDADAAMACARALEAFRDALAGAAEQRRR